MMINLFIFILHQIQSTSSKENFEYSLTSKLNTGWLVADGTS